MEIRLTQEQEATLSQLAAAEGRSTDELVQEAIARFTVEKQADLMSDGEHNAALAEFRASLDEADASIDQGEGILIATEEDRLRFVGDIIDHARTRVAVRKPAH
jgi:hypothetical protein